MRRRAQWAWFSAVSTAFAYSLADRGCRFLRATEGIVWSIVYVVAGTRVPVRGPLLGRKVSGQPPQGLDGTVVVGGRKTGMDHHGAVLDHLAADP